MEDARVSLLHRHISLQVALASLLAIGVFVFVLLAGSVQRDLLGLMASGRLTPEMAGRMILLLLPYVIAYALPVGFLTAVLMVLGRMSANREIVAMKAAGISIYHLAAPIFFLALCGTALTGLINFQYAPMAKTAYRSALANVLRTDPLQFIQPRVFIKEFPGYVIYVEEQAKGEVRDLWVWELDERSRVRIFLRAETGTFDYNREEDAIVLTLRDAEAEWRDSENPEDFSQDIHLPWFAETEIRLPLDKILGQDTVHRKLSMLTLGELWQRRGELLAGDGPQQLAPDERRKELIRSQFTIQKNFAMAFSVLSFAALGIPLGIKASRSETYANIALALGVALVYYVLMVVIGFLEDKPIARPDLLIWLPNLFLQGAGLYLLTRANRH